LGDIEAEFLRPLKNAGLGWFSLFLEQKTDLDKF
jgi:hypothetical protein